MKAALITGASRGIGAAAAELIAGAGYAVAINYRENETAAKEVAEKITDFGGTAITVRGDISSPEEVSRIFEKIKDEFGGLELLVNNAGISYIGLLQDMTDSDIERLIKTDLMGAILCSREAAKLMIAKKRGSIINIASMWGEVGASCEAVYSACKAGIIGFTKALAKELGPSGIRVNCVSPGVIRTDMNSGLNRETLRELTEDTPLLRLGEPEDVAKAIAFLASDESDFITGQVLPVNGGITV